jgi:hypothetical protein
MLRGTEYYDANGKNILRLFAPGQRCVFPGKTGGSAA